MLRMAVYMAKLTEVSAHIVYSQDILVWQAVSLMIGHDPHRCYQQSAVHPAYSPHNGQVLCSDTHENHIPSHGSALAIEYIRDIPRLEDERNQLGGPQRTTEGTLLAL